MAKSVNTTFALYIIIGAILGGALAGVVGLIVGILAGAWLYNKSV